MQTGILMSLSKLHLIYSAYWTMHFTWIIECCIIPKRSHKRSYFLLGANHSTLIDISLIALKNALHLLLAVMCDILYQTTLKMPIITHCKIHWVASKIKCCYVFGYDYVTYYKTYVVCFWVDWHFDFNGRINLVPPYWHTQGVENTKNVIILFYMVYIIDSNRVTG